MYICNATSEVCLNTFIADMLDLWQLDQRAMKPRSPHSQRDWTEMLLLFGSVVSLSPLMFSLIYFSVCDKWPPEYQCETCSPNSHEAHNGTGK